MISGVKQANLAYDMSLSQVEISEVESDRSLFAPSWSVFSANAELDKFSCRIFVPDTGVLFSQRMFPSDRDLLIVDLKWLLNVIEWETCKTTIPKSFYMDRNGHIDQDTNNMKACKANKWIPI